MDELYKFGVCDVIRDRNQNNIGVFAAMVGTASTEGSIGLSSERGQTVLVGECDTNRNPYRGASDRKVIPEFVVFWHPEYSNSTLAVEIKHPYLRTLMAANGSAQEPRNDAQYEDPVPPGYQRLTGRWLTGSARRLFGDHWLAGFARVENTPYIVIYQTRNWVADALMGTGLVFMVAVIVLGLWRLFRRSGQPVGSA